MAFRLPLQPANSLLFLGTLIRTWYRSASLGPGSIASFFPNLQAEPVSATIMLAGSIGAMYGGRHW
jgi:hypothetical protein